MKLPRGSLIFGWTFVPHHADDARELAAMREHTQRCLWYKVGQWFMDGGTAQVRYLGERRQDVPALYGETRAEYTIEVAIIPIIPGED